MRFFGWIWKPPEKRRADEGRHWRRLFPGRRVQIPQVSPGPLPSCPGATALGRCGRGVCLTQDPHVIIHPEQGPLLRPPIYRLALGRLLDADGPGEPRQGRGERHGEAGPHGSPERPAAVADAPLGSGQGSGTAQQGPARRSQQQRCRRGRRHGDDPRAPGTGRAAAPSGRPFRRGAQGRAGDVAPTVGGAGEPAIGRAAGARRSRRALIGPWREGAG